VIYIIYQSQNPPHFIKIRSDTPAKIASSISLSLLAALSKTRSRPQQAADCAVSV
jgi:hypothetical protein